ncbi:putative manganese transporter [Photobacterium halotolerans]|uniref:putative manganese transporter n=1 Tax=Photobacterium halotolerans TaxID=265726 RepID=UPI000405FEBD|nr:putative manganese transporter [Photobacterium halotolerans]
MTSQVKSAPFHKLGDRWRLANKRLVLPVLLVAMLAAPATRELTVSVLADAFWQVAAYVAITLALYHWLSERLNHQSAFTLRLKNSRRYQVVFASVMGALPGCGGAIIVITQFVRGQLSFGSVVAVLTATMGDAAFLLLAAKPSTGLFIISIGLVVGMLSGWLVDTLHGSAFLQPQHSEATAACCRATSSGYQVPAVRWQGTFWQWLLIPSAVIALMGSFQLNTDALLHLPEGSITVLGAFFALVAMLLWSLSRDIQGYQDAVSEDPKSDKASLFQRVAQDTNFVTTWVISAFLCFEVAIKLTGWDIAASLSHWSAALPLAGVLIGLIPGCGPQILITSFYLHGAIPISAQLGNALSNDGDALFPAIALAPKAALIATLYSSLPALFVAYSYYYFFE